MKLHPEPFAQIRGGRKTVEARLFDEKRRQLKIGEKIELFKRPDFKEVIIAKIIGLRAFKTFSELFDTYRERVWSGSKEAFLGDVRRYYSDEDEKRNGVIGIEMEIEPKTG